MSTKMSKGQAIGFFEQVRGYRIRKTCWLEGRYFTPDSLTIGVDDNDHVLEGENDHGIRVRFGADNGFDLDPKNAFGTWEFFDTRKKGQVISGSCKCSSYDLLNFGHSKSCVFYKPLKKLGSGV